ncbi:hypothetical protein F4556_003779 [Kitasatospora gansuensis]|uniref:Uncharacterized protein n=1 Tax=Kitasatospora gansuensis TaxID=258050 RepID=A0A7W7SD40_9ACTN|nr:hypothetical protein [Kitasatospora gansuensis]MBB4948244.1 hypothetical protein [Kitasatospora gansuensis]
MTHNDVVRRAAYPQPTLSVRPLTLRSLAGQLDPVPVEPYLRSLERPLHPRTLHRICEGGR